MAADYAIQISPKESKPKELELGLNRPAEARDAVDASLARELADGAVTMLCPCVSAAQVASSLGSPYYAALAYFMTLFVGGGLFYAIAVDAEERDGGESLACVALVAMMRQYLVFLCGPFVSMVGDFVFGPLQSDVADALNGYEDKARLVRCVALDFIFDCLFVASVWVLRTGLRPRVSLTRGPGSCGDCLLATCCASCALCEMTTKVKRHARKSACNFGPVNSLAAYPSQ